MNEEAIKQIVQSYTNAGWENDDSFSGYLVIGFSGDNFSIVAHEEEDAAVGATEPVYSPLVVLTRLAPQAARNTSLNKLTTA